MVKLTVLFLMSLVAISACSPGKGTDVAVPRRKAYPRMELPDSVFVDGRGIPCSLQTNVASSVEVTRDDKAGKWVNVSYPDLGAYILFTFTPVGKSTIEGVIDNRLERIALNLGGGGAEIVEFNSPEGFVSRVIRGEQGITPVQFLSTDNKEIVVSGAAYVPGFSPELSDSLSPVVDMLHRDIVHALKTLKHD